MNKFVLLALMLICGGAQADSQKAAEPDPSVSKNSTKFSEKLVREGGSCYRETTIERMVEDCTEHVTFYTPVSETRRVKIDCPANEGQAPQAR